MTGDTAAKPPLRLWFQAGTRDEAEDRDGNGVIDAIQDTTELIDELAAKGVEFTDGPNEQPYGVDAGIRDPFGNKLRFVQPNVGGS